LPDLRGIGYQPASTTARVAATAVLPAERLRELLGELEPSALPRPRPPATRMSAPSMSTSAPALSPRSTIEACVDHGEYSTVDVDDLSRAAVLRDGLKRVDPPDDDPEVAPGNAKPRSWSPGESGARPRACRLGPDAVTSMVTPPACARRARPDLKAQQSRRRTARRTAVVVDHLRHNVDHWLGEPSSPLARKTLVAP